MKTKAKIIISAILVAASLTFIVLSLALPISNTDKFYQTDELGMISTVTVVHREVMGFYLGYVLVGLLIALDTVTVVLNGLCIFLTLKDRHGNALSFYAGIVAFAFAALTFAAAVTLSATGNFFKY